MCKDAESDIRISKYPRWIDTAKGKEAMSNYRGSRAQERGHVIYTLECSPYVMLGNCGDAEFIRRRIALLWLNTSGAHARGWQAAI